MTTPRPWTCARCGSRLLWRRESLDCPEHGRLAPLPPAPAAPTMPSPGPLRPVDP